METQRPELTCPKVSELEQGVHRADNEGRPERRRAFVDSILAQVGIAPIDLRVARGHALLAAESTTAGDLTTDTHLAALAIHHGAALVSCDRDFQRFDQSRWEHPL